MVTQRDLLKTLLILADAEDYGNDNEVIIEEIPLVHHLGDDFFGGTVNLQFQRSTEGSSYIRNFSLTNDQILSSELTLLTAAKGLQRANKIYINDVLVRTFVNTTTNGSYTSLELPLTISAGLLTEGTNVIEIRSVATGRTATDFDDLEFVNISITGFSQ